MRIYIIHQYFKTPLDGGGIRSYYISKYLVEQGHDVSVVTAYNGEEYKQESVEGITVHYLPVYYTNHLSFWSRVHAFYRFVWMSIRLISKMPRPDVNYVISTPLSTGIIALYLKKTKKIPFIFEVGDLWPKAPIQLGVIKNILLKRVSIWLEKRIYQKAQSIVALSPDIQAEIQNIVPAKPIKVVTNMADTGFFIPENKSNEYLKKYELENKFVISYTGTVGLANHLEYLLSAAKACLPFEGIRFIVMGSGAKWDYINALAKKEQLNNILFLSSGDKQQVKEILNVSDAIYISFKNAPVLASGSPNKFFDGLAAGKLIIINFKGWIKDLIEQHNCGFSYDPEKPEEFIKQLTPYLEDKTALKSMHCNSRKLAESSFAINQQLEELADFIERN